MFLTNVSENYNSLNDTDDILDVISEGFESLMEMQDFESDYKMKMIVLEHHSIISENTELYSEGVKELGLRILEQIKKILDFIRIKMQQALAKVKTLWVKAKSANNGKNANAGFITTAQKKAVVEIAAIVLKLDTLTHGNITKETIAEIGTVTKELSDVKTKTGKEFESGSAVSMTELGSQIDKTFDYYKKSIASSSKGLNEARTKVQAALKSGNQEELNEARLEVEFYSKLTSAEFKLFSRLAGIISKASSQRGAEGFGLGDKIKNKDAKTSFDMTNA